MFEAVFAMSELNKQLKKLKRRKSPGSDKLHNEVLIHLGHIGKRAVSFLKFSLTYILTRNCYADVIADVRH